MAALFTCLALGQAKVSITAANLAVIAPRWLSLSAFFSSVGLHLSRLVSRNGSHLIAFGLLAIFATVIERQGLLLRSNFAWLVDTTTALSSPIVTMLREPVASLVLTRYASALLLLAAYTLALFALAAWLFRRKDLLWVD
jgi:hypothetical protein